MVTSSKDTLQFEEHHKRLWRHFALHVEATVLIDASSSCVYAPVPEDLCKGCTWDPRLNKFTWHSLRIIFSGNRCTCLAVTFCWVTLSVTNTRNVGACRWTRQRKIAGNRLSEKRSWNYCRTSGHSMLFLYPNLFCSHSRPQFNRHCLGTSWTTFAILWFRFFVIHYMKFFCAYKPVRLLVQHPKTQGSIELWIWEFNFAMHFLDAACTFTSPPNAVDPAPFRFSADHTTFRICVFSYYFS